MPEIQNTIDDDLNFILNGGAKKSKTKNKSKSKSKSKPKSGSKSKKTKIVIEAGSIIKNTETDITDKTNEISENIDTIKPDQSRLQRPRIIKKNADENKEYISVKTEKPTKKDNSYKTYDVAFLKRLQKSKIESNTTEEED